MLRLKAPQHLCAHTQVSPGFNRLFTTVFTHGEIQFNKNTRDPEDAQSQ